MRLSELGITILRGSEKIRERLRASFDITSTTVNRWVRENDDNLTKAAALSIIREETGLSDSEILENESVEVKG